jgi:hypothetical protein
VLVALGIQQAMHMRNIILSSVACPAVQNISISSHKWQDLNKKGS